MFVSKFYFYTSFPFANSPWILNLLHYKELFKQKNIYYGFLLHEKADIERFSPSKPAGLINEIVDGGLANIYM